MRALLCGGIHAKVWAKWALFMQKQPDALCGRLFCDADQPMIHWAIQIMQGRVMTESTEVTPTVRAA